MNQHGKRFVVSPGGIGGGRITVPGDKSISHRALMFGALAEGSTIIRGFLPGEDCLATLQALQQLGVSIDMQDPAEIHISGMGQAGLRAAGTDLDLGNSGTAMRLMAGLLAGQPFKSVLTGDESLRCRPMERVASPLREMGAEVETTDGCAPIVIHGAQLRGIHFVSPVASAQLKSAVLLASLFATGKTTVVEPGVTRDHTEKMLANFGIKLELGHLRVSLAGPQQLVATDVDVPGDLSSAAFVLGAGLLGTGGEVRVDGVGINPTRTGVLDILDLMGAEIEIENRRMLGLEPVADLLVSPARLRGANIPAELVPLAIDELPLIFALAACAQGKTTIRGAAELRHKESDRIAMMAQGLAELGIDVEEFSDGIAIRGGQLTGGTVNSGGDHRVAMAFAVIASRASAPVEILDTANVNTSFPGFCALLKSLGLAIEDLET